jgi:tetratricopeptide (TPR) repeat protein
MSVRQTTAKSFSNKLTIFIICIISLSLATFVCAQIPNHERPEPTPFDKGNYFLANQQFQQALDVFKEISEGEPANSYAFRGMVRAWVGLNKVEQGEKYLNDYLLRQENSDSALYALGYLYYSIDKLDESEKLLNKAIKINPPNSLALNNLGAVYSQQNKIPEAVEIIKKAIILKPTEMIFYTNLFKVYSEAGYPEKLLTDYRESSKINSPAVTYGYGVTLARYLRQEGFKSYSKGHLNKTIDSFLELLTIYKEIKRDSGVVATLFSLGILYEEQGNIIKAKECFLNVLEINPNHLQARERIKALKTK